MDRGKLKMGDARVRGIIKITQINWSGAMREWITIEKNKITIQTAAGVAGE